MVSHSAPGFPPRNVGPLRVRSADAAELGNHPIGAALMCLPKPLSGMGTNRQLQGVAQGMAALAGAHGFELSYVGPKVEGFGEHLASPYAAIEPAETVAGSYLAVQKAFESALGRLARAGVKSLAVLCLGYTAYGPEGIKRALRALDESGAAAPSRVHVLIIDSAYPDTDREERELDADGWPLGRFYAPAFAGDERVSTLFLLTSAYAYPPEVLNQRAPTGLGGVSVIAPPYSDGYLEQLERDGTEGAGKGLGDLLETLPGMRELGEGDLVVPVVASDIWSESAVGAWMTKEEHHSCVQGTEAIIRALKRTAEGQGRRIWVPVDDSGARFAAGLGIPGVAVLRRSGESPGKSRVVLTAYSNLPQSEHSRLLGAADFAVSRTGGQANATVVLALAKTANVVVDMPARGYMQSELSTLAMTCDMKVAADGTVTYKEKKSPLAWRGEWRWSPERLATLFAEVLTDPGENRRRTEAARRAFHELRSSPKGNVFSILKRFF